MRVATYCYRDQLSGDAIKDGHPDNGKVRLVMGFGARARLEEETVYQQLRKRYPVAEIVLCSTSGEISEANVADGTISVTAIEWEKTTIRTASVCIDDFGGNSYEAGVSLASRFPAEGDLCHILIVSDGAKVNGSELVKGINSQVQRRVAVTGGLAGDGYGFQSTLTGLNGPSAPGNIIAVAFYGKDLVVSHGTMGGWEMFGPERTVTKSVANQVFEINHECALDVYKKYLGPYAEELPGSALLFPLSVKLSADREPVVRTILSIDTVSGSMVFAGDVPEGSNVRFMKANFDKLIEAASQAAWQALEHSWRNPSLKALMYAAPKLALLISCVGRKIILGERVEEEVEAVQHVLGDRTVITGFYSYGELAPFSADGSCELHNQTMTITTFDEL